MLTGNTVRLWNKVLVTDITVEVPKLDVPVYFLLGRYDYTTSYTLAKAYVKKLQAPLKGFHTYEHSAHSPIFEGAEKTRTILRKDVLTGSNGLGDIEIETSASAIHPR
jgi:pimeloyl-ACP methyl ester carboxylesterase